MKNLMRTLCALTILLLSQQMLRAQDTFSIVACDSVTGEVGSAGASCVALFGTGYPADFLGDLIPGVGAINSQAYYLPANQANARTRMLAGDSPDQIIAWLKANDVQGDSTIRQYGIVRIDSNYKPASAAHTGSGTDPYKGHRLGPNYSIQGNILLGPEILDSMEARFNNTQGNLAAKLMAALQGANVPGADTRCAPYGTPSLFSFLKVSKPTDPDGQPYIKLRVITSASSGVQPIDSLQVLYNNWLASTPVESELQGKLDLAIHPNPSGGQLSLRLKGFQGYLQYQIMDLRGATLASGNRSFTGQRVNLDINQLSPGTYLIRATNRKGEILVRKFMKY